MSAAHVITVVRRSH